MPHRRVVRDRVAGFTLVELLVVVALVGLLIALLLPAVHAAREAARRAGCGNNLRQIGIAMHAYHASSGTFPPGFVATLEGTINIGPGWGWAAMLLPALDQAPLFNAINIARQIPHAESLTARRCSLATFLCPSSTGDGPLSVACAFYDGSTRVVVDDLAPSQYVASAGQKSARPPSGAYNGIFFPNSRIGIGAILDGSGSTLMAGERSRDLADASWVGAIPAARLCTNPARPVRSCEPSDAMVLGYTGPVAPGAAWVEAPGYAGAGPDDFASMHPGGCNFLLCDGSARLLKRSVDPRVFSALSTRSGAEVIGVDQY